MPPIYYIGLGFIIGLSAGVLGTFGVFVVISASMLSSQIDQDQERWEQQNGRG